MHDIMPFIHENLFLSMGWLALTIAIVYMSMKLLLSKTKEIDRTQATLLINRQNAVVVDVRPKAEFQAGHIANSINLQPDDIAKNNLVGLDKNKERPIIVACLYGLAPSHNAAENLIKLGFSEVYLLKAGIDGWNANNLPLVRH